MFISVVDLSIINASDEDVNCMNYPVILLYIIYTCVYVNLFNSDNNDYMINYKPRDYKDCMRIDCPHSSDLTSCSEHQSLKTIECHVIRQDESEHMATSLQYIWVVSWEGVVKYSRWLWFQDLFCIHFRLKGSFDPI